MQPSRASTALLIGIALALAARDGRAQNGEDEHKLAAAQVPQPVKDAVTRAWPNARVAGWSSERERGTTVYEAETLDGTTRRDVLISTGGSILETETTVTPAQLPAAVRTAATAGGRVIERAEQVVAGRDTTYEFKLRGQRAELKLLPNGQPVRARSPGR